MKLLTVTVILVVCLALVIADTHDDGDGDGGHQEGPGPGPGNKKPRNCDARAKMGSGRPEPPSDDVEPTAPERSQTKTKRGPQVKVGGGRGVEIGEKGEKGGKCEYDFAGLYENKDGDNGVERIGQADGTCGKKGLSTASSEAIPQDIPYTVDESDPEQAVAGLCVTETTTLMTDVEAEVQCCIAQANGTVTLDANSDAPEVIAFNEGAVKCFLTIKSYTFCGDDNGRDCSGDVGTQLCIRNIFRGPKGKKVNKKETKVPPGQKSGTRGGKVYGFGTDGPKIAFASKVYCWEDANGRESGTWFDIIGGSEGITLEEEDDEDGAHNDDQDGDEDDQEIASSDICIERPALAGPITCEYDPTIEIGTGEDEEDGTGAATTLLSSLYLSLLSFILTLIMSHK